MKYRAEFAAAHGSKPEEIGTGHSVGVRYFRWVKGEWTEFRKLRPDLFNVHGATPEAQEPFSAWLAGRYPSESRQPAGVPS